MPTIEEVCKTFEVTDVPIEYTEQDYQNLITYKMFQQHVRPLLQKENPKVPIGKLMMLVAAKWREFCDINPNLQSNKEEKEKDQPQTPPKSPASSKKGKSSAKSEDDEEEEDRESSKKRSRRGGGRTSKKGRKPKVPTLKIKFGKRRNASSEEEPEESAGSERDSDIEFEKMLQQTEEPSGKEDKESTSMGGETEGGDGSNNEPVVRKKAKTKIGNKAKKKVKRKMPDEDFDHQDYCEVCQQGEFIIIS